MYAKPDRKPVFSRFELPILLLLIPILIFLVWWNLDGYPVTNGWDEGFYLQFSQNLSHHGLYATHDGNQYHVLVPVSGTGPVVIGSVALGMKMFGDTLLAARSMMAGYLLLSVIGLFLLVREISRWEIAILAVFIYLAAGYNIYDTLWLGRQVLGEIPAYGILFFGLWSLIKVIKRSSALWLIASLILLGLSVITKNQLVWILAPTLAAMALIDLFIFKEKHWKVYLAAAGAVVVAYLAWDLAALIMVGNERAVYQQLQTATFVAVYLRVSFGRTKENIKLMLDNGFLIPIGAAILYSIIRLFGKKVEQRQALTLLLILAVIGLCNSFFLGLPWARYIYTGIVVSIPILAFLFADTITWLRSQRLTTLRGLAALGLLVFFGFIAYKLVFDGFLIAQTQNHDAQQFAELVDRTVPNGAEVLNWEWEVEFFSRSDYIHPDYMLSTALFDQTYGHVNEPILQKQRIPDGIHYLVAGPYATETGVFASEEKQRAATTIGQIGAYSLVYLK